MLNDHTPLSQLRRSFTKNQFSPQDDSSQTTKTASKTRLAFIVKVYRRGLVIPLYKARTNGLNTWRERQVLGQYLIQAESFTDTLKNLKYHLSPKSPLRIS